MVAGFLLSDETFASTLRNRRIMATRASQSISKMHISGVRMFQK